MRLQFRNKLALPLFTGSKVEGEQGSAIHVVLQHAGTGQVVTTGPEASAKLDIVVLEGDFTAEDEDDWTQEEFENCEVRERDGKRPLLTGDLSVSLKDGVGTLGELTFTDNSSWIRSRKFRLGVKISSGYCEGLRIREAKTEAFTVKDHRGERKIIASHILFGVLSLICGLLHIDLHVLAQPNCSVVGFLMMGVSSQHGYTLHALCTSIRSVLNAVINRRKIISLYLIIVVGHLVQSTRSTIRLL